MKSPRGNYVLPSYSSLKTLFVGCLLQNTDFGFFFGLNSKPDRTWSNLIKFSPLFFKCFAQNLGMPKVKGQYFMVILGHIKFFLAAGHEKNIWSFWHEVKMQFPPLLQRKIIHKRMAEMKILKCSITFWLQDVVTVNLPIYFANLMQITFQITFENSYWIF